MEMGGVVTGYAYQRPMQKVCKAVTRWPAKGAMILKQEAKTKLLWQYTYHLLPTLTNMALFSTVWKPT